MQELFTAPNRLSLKLWMLSEPVAAAMISAPNPPSAAASVGVAKPV